VTSPLRPGRGGLLLDVRVTPKASRDEVSGLHTGADGAMSLAVKVTAVPDKGKANKAVIEVIAKWARLPKSAFSLVSGETERNKVLLVTGNPAGLEALVAALKETTSGMG
jgi:uncharacterized protein (TIGR00251 family)